MSDDNDTKPPTATTDQGILANDHDVDKLNEDIGKLLLGLRQHGVVLNLDAIDLNGLRPRVEAVSACRMLVAKGVCTGAEMAAMVNSELRQILAMILQAAEEQRLTHPQQQQPPKPEDRIIKPAGAGKLAIVRH